MNAKDYLVHILPKTINYQMARSGFIGSANPITLTYSVTAARQSKCKTCNIGLKYHHDPKRKERDLNLEEIEKIFRTLGPIYFFNVSGGEPFLRKDLPEIIQLACRHLKPRIIHIPTNAIASRRIKDLTLQCLEVINQYDPKIPFTVKPSIDGVGNVHDEIRGVKGNFKQLGEDHLIFKRTREGLSKFSS